LIRFNLYRNLAGAILNVLLNLFLIPRHGAVGAAFATLISLAFAHFLFAAFSASTRVVFRLQLRAMILRPQA